LEPRFIDGRCEGHRILSGRAVENKSGRIRWQPTAEDETYIAVLKDQDGRVLATITSGGAGIDEHDIRELYEGARR